MTESGSYDYFKSDFFNRIRQLWTARLILNRLGRQRADIGKDVASGLADMEAYGQMILANLDFLARLKASAPLNKADRKTFFSGA